MAYAAQPIASIRAGDYWRFGLSVKAECICGRSRIVSPSVLIKLYGDEARLGDDRLGMLASKLVCGSCGARNPKLTTGEFG